MSEKATKLSSSLHTSSFKHPIYYIQSMFLRSTRLLHTTRALRSEASGGVAAVIEEAAARLGSGKKKPPKKQSLIILDASQSKLVRRKRKSEKSHASGTLSVEDRRQLREASKLLNAVPVSQTTPELISKTINALKPENNLLSKGRYEQLDRDLSNMLTLEQLRAFIKSEYPSVRVFKKHTKQVLIEKIVRLCWKMEISTDTSAPDEMIVNCSFDLSKKQMFLLLSQDSIIKNWMRANVKIVMLTESWQMLVRAPEAHIQYIELALASIFKNIKTEDVDLGQVDALFKNSGEKLPMDDIQKLTGVYFEPKVGENDEVLPNEYIMSSLGRKKFDQAKRLILWSLDYNPFTKVSMHIDLQDKKCKMFRQYPDNSLPWIHRNKTWMRLKEPRSLIGLPKNVKLDTEKIYQELYEEEEPQSDCQSVTAVSFGQLLFDESSLSSPSPKSTMNTNIPLAHERIHKLPIYEANTEETDITVDQHIYYAQIRLVPSPFNKDNSYMTCPPVEFWVETDQDNKALMDSFQVLCIINERNSSISLPSQTTDIKFVRSDTKDLIESYSNSQETWLDDQPGIKEFLENAVLDFSGDRAIRVPEYCDIILPGRPEPVRYDYVNMTHRKQIDLKFKDRLLTYTVMEGGSLGGRTAEVIMVGKDRKMTKKQFEEFVKDSEEFIQSLQ